MNELESKWQAALRRRFPGIVVRQNFNMPDDDTPDLNVFMVPNDRMVEFSRFLINERFNLMNCENLPDVNLLECSVSETERLHPDIYAEAQSEIRRSGRATKSAKSSRKPSPKKSALRAPAAARR